MFFLLSFQFLESYIYIYTYLYSLQKIRFFPGKTNWNLSALETQVVRLKWRWSETMPFADEKTGRNASVPLIFCKKWAKMFIFSLGGRSPILIFQFFGESFGLSIGVKWISANICKEGSRQQRMVQQAQKLEQVSDQSSYPWVLGSINTETVSILADSEPFSMRGEAVMSCCLQASCLDSESMVP